MDLLDTVSKLFPVLLIIIVGYGMRYSGTLNDRDGSALLKLVYYIGAPSLIITTVSTATFDTSLLKIGILAPAVIAASILVLYMLRKTSLRAVPHKTFGSLAIGVMIMNTLFLLPIVSQLYGQEGVALLLIIDTINALLVFSVVYAMAVRFGGDHPKLSDIAKKVVFSPPLWALALALTLQSTDSSLPEAATNFLDIPAKVTPAIILIALGVKLSFRTAKPSLLASGLALRFGIGGLVGLTIVYALGLEGVAASIVLLASLAPVGFNSLLFAELEGLDQPFAASQVSLSLIVATVALPFLLLVL